MPKFKRFEGLIAAVPTPMHADGSLWLEQAPALVEHLVREGVAGIYALGSTGEGVSLATDERMVTAEAFIAAARGRLPVLVQVGHNSLEEAARLARHAQSAGAAAISATPPSYFKPASIEALTRSMAQVAAAARELPFYYYHIPKMTGVDLDMHDFMSRASQAIPNLAGMKFTGTSHWEMQSVIDLGGDRFDILSGADEMLLSALTLGARGAVGTTYNYAAPLYLRLIDAFQSGDGAAARLAQSRAVAFIRIIIRHGPLPASKAIMSMLGIDCGPVRLPLMMLAAEQTAALKRDLEAIGFFDWAR